MLRVSFSCLFDLRDIKPCSFIKVLPDVLNGTYLQTYFRTINVIVKDQGGVILKFFS